MSHSSENGAATASSEHPSSTSAEFAEIVRRIDDQQLSRAMSDPMSRLLVLHGVFAEMPRRAVGDRLAGVHAVIRFRVGEPPATWTVIVENATCIVHEGELAGRPTVTLELGMVPFLRLIAGQTGGMALMATGKLRIKGNLMTARKIEEWFARH